MNRNEKSLRNISSRILHEAPLRELCRLSGIKHPQTVKYYLEKIGIERPQNNLLSARKKLNKGEVYTLKYYRKRIKELEADVTRKNIIIDKFFKI